MMSTESLHYAGHQFLILCVTSPDPGMTAAAHLQDSKQTLVMHACNAVVTLYTACPLCHKHMCTWCGNSTTSAVPYSVTTLHSLQYAPVCSMMLDAVHVLPVCLQYHAKEHAAVKPFRPVSGSKARLSMWSPNPYTTDPRPAPNIDFTIT
jgi:hypothetical protein